MGLTARVEYTGYVDAIEMLAEILPVAERRKPPGSPVHVNQYQTEDLGLRGDVTDEDLEGVVPINILQNDEVNLGPLLGPHIQIDFADDVIDRNIGDVMQFIPNR